MISLVGYDENNEMKENKMMDSLKVFEQSINLECFKKTKILIFWNKTDILEKSISKENKLEELFSDYKGAQDVQKATEFIQDVFKSRIEDFTNRQIMEFTGSALNTNDIKEVFKLVQSNI